MYWKRPGLLACLLALVVVPCLRADEPPEPKRTRDLIYGRKFGLALTMDMFQPAKPNGAAVVWVISGGWFSTPDAINPVFTTELLKRGYTVFCVVHGSQPKFTIPEIVEDMHRAIRFIRGKARDFQFDPDRLGIIGMSAGGHLSLLLGTSGGPGDAQARDPIDRGSSAVQAVACFCPPTDFLNYGGKGKELLARSFQPPFTAATDYHEFDPEKALYLPITDQTRLRDICRKISPITHVSPKSAPTLILHGDKDTLVPIQQSESFIARLKEANVTCELVVRKGAAHVWPTVLLDLALCADWFDKHLKNGKEEK